MSLTLLLLLCSFDASSWPRLQEPGVPALKRSCGTCVTRPCLPSYPHFNISSVFGGVLVQLEKLLRTATANRIRADISPCQLWHCYLPESTQRMGGIRKRGWWESVCATSSLFTKADHCWRSTWSRLWTPRGSFSDPPPPFSLCQIFKVCNEAVIIYSPLPFCPSLPAPSITTSNFTAISAELKNKQTCNCLKMLFKKYDKVKTRKSSCVLNQDGHY